MRSLQRAMIQDRRPENEHGHEQDEPTVSIDALIDPGPHTLPKPKHADPITSTLQAGSSHTSSIEQAIPDDGPKMRSVDLVDCGAGSAAHS